ncbi:MAG: oxygen-independent coproporphyrinogen III oxidase [Bacteroidales bacterium]
MENHSLLNKYNIPTPRYTSYPPANYFHSDFTDIDYRKAIDLSNTDDALISFYIHLPFCRHLCYYCGCNSLPMANNYVIEKYLDALYREIEMITPLLNSRRKIAQIHYGGGSPTAIQVYHLKRIKDLLLSKFDQIENPEIAIECHPGYLHEKDWEELRDAGFTRFSIGIQDFQEDVLKTVNRRPSIIPAEQIVPFLQEKGAAVNLDFIYGLPGQTIDSFRHNMNRAAKISPDRIVTFSYAHVPWVNKLQLQLEKAGLPAPAMKEQLYGTAREVLNSHNYKALGLDHFVRHDDELMSALQKGLLHRNFQGYCTKRTTGEVYAFGISGISQLSDAYIQNRKDLNQYIEMISKGLLPVEKGYRLTTREQMIRKVIDVLMCNSYINWDRIASELSCSTEELHRNVTVDMTALEQFRKDGILEYSDSEIRVKEKHTVFLRNVAALFDPLQRTRSKSFSKPL